MEVYSDYKLIAVPWYHNSPVLALQHMDCVIDASQRIQYTPAYPTFGDPNLRVNRTTNFIPDFFWGGYDLLSELSAYPNFTSYSQEVRIRGSVLYT